MPEPVLLMRPEEMRDRNGEVTPTSSGTITEVSGEHGQAWSFATNAYLQIDAANHISATAFTVLVRASFPEGTTGGSYPFDCNRTSGVLIGRVGSNGTLGFYTGGNTPDSNLTPVSLGESHVLGGRYTTAEKSAWLNGVNVNTVGDPDAITLGSVIRIGANQGSANTVESVLVYDTALSDTDMQAISTMDEAWSWNLLNPASTAPRPSRVFVPGSPYNLGPLTPH